MANPVEAGGAGMWILLGYLVVLFPLIWGFGAAQVLALIRWKRMSAALGRFAGEKDAAGLADHLDGKAGRGVMGDVLAAAARSVVEGEKPTAVMDAARKAVDERMSASPPAKAVLCALALALGSLGPLVLGALLRCMNAIEVWSVVVQDNPYFRCRLLEAGMPRGELPFWLGVGVCVVLTVPALVAVFVQLNPLGAGRRRDDVLRLVESLLGRSARPVTGTASGLLAFASTILLTAAAGWVLTGPPVSNLAAPRLIDTCVPGLVHRDVRVPLHDGPAVKVTQTRTLIVTTGDILFEQLVFSEMDPRPDAPAAEFESQRVTDLVDGKLGASLGGDGVTVEPLAEMLEDLYKKDMSQCLVPDCSTWGDDPILAIIAADVPVETAAAVLATARRSRSRSVFVLVRTEAPAADPPDLAGMLEAVKGFASMKCVMRCPYGALEVGDVGDVPVGGTFGEFIEGVEGPSFDVAAR